MLRAAEHVPDMLRLDRRGDASATSVHFQWLPLEPLDTLLLPSQRPRVFTVHNTLRRGEGRAREAITRRLAGQMDALVVHARAGAAELVDRFGADPDRVHVIPHGAFDYLTRLPREEPLPAELAAVEGPVILFFGLVRPYKGVDVLLEAFRELDGAELWVVGLPHVDMAPLRARRRAGARDGALRGAVRDRPADPRLLPPRGHRGAALPARSTSRACSTRRSPSARRSCSRTSAASARWPAITARRASWRRRTPSRCARLSPLLVADPGERDALAARAQPRPRRAPSPGTTIGRRTLRLYEELLA